MSSPTFPPSSEQSGAGPSSPINIQETKDPFDKLNVGEAETELEARRGRKRSSKVWEVFEEVEITEKSGKKVDKLRCRLCHKKYSKTKTGTTSQLVRHLNECFYLINRAKDQSVINFSSVDAQTTDLQIPMVYNGSYDHSKIREIMAKMIIAHEYPFIMVEHAWFNILCKALNPNFVKVSRTTIRNECMKVYDAERDKLKKIFKTIHRISLTCDCWTSKQTIGYMALTAHYIDSNWQLQKCIINFVELEPPHTGLVISDAISDCILEWGIQDKVSTITLDNASSNDVAARSLMSNFQRRNKLHFKGMFFHIRCCAHVLNLMVQDGLQEINEIIHDIRESVKYLKKSPARVHKFGEIAKQLGVSTERGLSSDVPTRWNSTYKMLDAAFHYRMVFGEYAKRDPSYRWSPSEDAWENYEKIRKLLEVFYDVTAIYSGTDYPTSNKFLRETFRIKKILAEQVSSDDLFMRNMAEVMAHKFDKYWGSCNLLMAIAGVLDPRWKMLLVQFTFPKIYPANEVEENITKVQRALFDLFDSYASNYYSSLSEQFENSVADSNIDVPSSSKKQKAGEEDLEDFVRNCSVIQPAKSDLEIYLEEGCVVVDREKTDTFDVLSWWKLNSVKFRVLSKLARDVLSIPITTVASESAFSAGGRVLDDYRSSLASKTVEALVCAGNWIRNSQKTPTTLSVSILWQ